MDGGEGVECRRLFGSMMLQGKEGSESNSKRCSFGNKGGAERSDWVRFCRPRRELVRVLI